MSRTDRKAVQKRNDGALFHVGFTKKVVDQLVI